MQFALLQQLETPLYQHSAHQYIQLRSFRNYTHLNQDPGQSGVVCDSKERSDVNDMVKSRGWCRITEERNPHYKAIKG